jgi:GxxExxY protein
MEHKTVNATSRFSENDLSYLIIGAATDLHRTLGPGLLESAYEVALVYELNELGLQVKTQVPIPLIYKGIKLEVAYRLDLLVEDKVIVELKAVEFIHDIHFAQTLTYLKLSGKKLALLINFNSKLLKHGIHRIINKL